MWPTGSLARRLPVRLDKKRGLVSSAVVFGMLVTLISKENSVRFAFADGKPNPRLRPQL
jgi:hypothetical protein